jgi:hypothetical protein
VFSRSEKGISQYCHVCSKRCLQVDEIDANESASMKFSSFPIPVRLYFQGSAQLDLTSSIPRQELLVRDQKESFHDMLSQTEDNNGPVSSRL